MFCNATIIVNSSDDIAVLQNTIRFNYSKIKVVDKIYKFKNQFNFCSNVCTLQKTLFCRKRISSK